ncbi:MAG: D-alanyl-D-alanine carboxypeptidase family protein [Actinomycetia bacterium]|nr:D-alanyl-D-alanine carboxypeptidase family protein [Actinomycetes bacterium]
MPSLSTLHPAFRPHAESFFAWARQVFGGGLVVTSARRTWADQERLYRRSLAGQNDGLPASPPGSSDHELGLAMDLAFLNARAIDDPRLRELGSAWTRAGGKWWESDPVHFGAPRSWIDAARGGRSRRRRV